MGELLRHLHWVADYAEVYGLLDGERVWMIGAEGGLGGLDFPELAGMASFGDNTNVTKLIRGLAAIRVLDGFNSDPVGDKFLA